MKINDIYDLNPYLTHEKLVSMGCDFEVLDRFMRAETHVKRKALRDETLLLINEDKLL